MRTECDLECDDEAGERLARLWDATMRRVMLSRPGLATLRSLEAGLLALPEKKLVGERLARDGCVCANGALLMQMGVPMTELEAAQREEDGDDEDDPECPYIHDSVAVRMAGERGVSKYISITIAYANDRRQSESDEERYERMLEWTRSRIAEAEAHQEARRRARGITEGGK